MPYKVSIYCTKCNYIDDCIIGLWQKYLGLYICDNCQRIVNIPVGGHLCTLCSTKVKTENFYDYSYCIQYSDEIESAKGTGDPLSFLGDFQFESLEKGPKCLQCNKKHLQFKIVDHFSCSLDEYNSNAWYGKDYLEKAIYAHSVVSICNEWELDVKEICALYCLDIPKSLMEERKICMPIRQEILDDLTSTTIDGTSSFSVSGKFAKKIQEECAQMEKFLLDGKQEGFGIDYFDAAEFTKEEEPCNLDEQTIKIPFGYSQVTVGDQTFASSHESLILGELQNICFHCGNEAVDKVKIHSSLFPELAIPACQAYKNIVKKYRNRSIWGFFYIFGGIVVLSSIADFFEITQPGVLSTILLIYMIVATLFMISSLSSYRRGGQYIIPQRKEKNNIILKFKNRHAFDKVSDSLY